MASTHEEISETFKGTRIERPQTSLAEGPPRPAEPRPPSHPWRRGLLWAGPVAGLAYGGYALAPTVKTMMETVSTDDAYVNGHVTYVAPRVPGQVSRVLVDDNERVSTGDLLVQLDREPYQVQVNLKKAAVVNAEVDVEAARAQVRGILAQARSQRWKLQRAIEDVDDTVASSGPGSRPCGAGRRPATSPRSTCPIHAAIQQGALSREDFDQRVTAVRAAEAAVKEALEEVHEARVASASHPHPERKDLTDVPADLNQTFSGVSEALNALLQSMTQAGFPLVSFSQTPRQALDEFAQPRQGGEHRPHPGADGAGGARGPAGRGQAPPGRARPRQAELDLRYCDIVSEIDGVVTSRSVNPGNNVSAGQSLMAVRSLTEIWIDANFKETQLADLRIGQRVRCEVNMYGGRKEFEGRITGFTMGTGQTLSLLPPQNATGNYVKIVQRLPVRIELADYDPDKAPLFAGLSVVPYVYYKEPPTGPNAGAVLQPLALHPTGPTEPGPSPASAARHE